MFHKSADRHAIWLNSLIKAASLQEFEEASDFIALEIKFYIINSKENEKSNSKSISKIDIQKIINDKVSQVKDVISEVDLKELSDFHNRLKFYDAHLKSAALHDKKIKNYASYYLCAPLAEAINEFASTMHKDEYAAFQMRYFSSIMYNLKRHISSQLKMLNLKIGSKTSTPESDEEKMPLIAKNQDAKLNKLFEVRDEFNQIIEKIDSDKQYDDAVAIKKKLKTLLNQYQNALNILHDLDTTLPTSKAKKLRESIKSGIFPSKPLSTKSTISKISEHASSFINDANTMISHAPEMPVSKKTKTNKK